MNLKVQRILSLKKPVMVPRAEYKRGSLRRCNLKISEEDSGNFRFVAVLCTEYFCSLPFNLQQNVKIPGQYCTVTYVMRIKDNRREDGCLLGCCAV
jgi:hypothetical protein